MMAYAFVFREIIDIFKNISDISTYSWVPAVYVAGINLLFEHILLSLQTLRMCI